MTSGNDVASKLRNIVSASSVCSSISTFILQKVSVVLHYLTCTGQENNIALLGSYHGFVVKMSIIDMGVYNTNNVYPYILNQLQK